MSSPGYLISLLRMRCPRCRRGPMFVNKNPWNLRRVLTMPKKCTECGQPYELEPGFWYGTAYVSYALTVLYLIVTFIVFWILIGMSVNDNRFFWWMGFAVISLLALQPWFMRISRVLYLGFFVKYNKNYKTEPTYKFDNS